MRQILGAAALSAMAAMPLAAQQAETVEAPSVSGPSWLVNCSNQFDAEVLACSMSQSVVIVETGARLLTAVFETTDTDDVLMSMVLPFGLDLTAPVTLNIDGEAWREVAVTTCDAEACYTQASIESAGIDALKAGGNLNVVLQNVQGQSVEMNLTLDGFTTSIELMS